MVPVIPATGALVLISAVLAGADVWPLGKIANLNQESNHVQVRHCHSNLLCRIGPVHGCGAGSLLPKQVIVLRTHVLHPGADVLRSVLLDSRTGNSGASGGLCAPPDAFGQYEFR